MMMEMTNAALPTPRVRVLHDARVYDFGNGATGQIERVSGRFDWVLDLPPTQRFPLGTVCGTSARGDTAFLNMWCRAAALSEPMPVELDDHPITIVDGVGRISADAVNGLASEAVTAIATEVATVYRKLLKARTGFAWSVRVGKRRARGTIRIMSAQSRQADGKMTFHDAALLASIVGANLVNPANGVTVSGEARERRAMVYLLAGVSQPCAPVLRLAR